MRFIYNILDRFGIANIGLCIILFTIIIYLLMLPLTIKQQKFSKMTSIMNPEIKAIQKKYENKKDQESMMKQNEEIQAVYQKYGVSATGGCLQMLIQLPILFSLYQVIMRIPAYVPELRNHYSAVVDAVSNGGGKIQKLFIQFSKDAGIKNISFGTKGSSVNELIDAMTKFTSDSIRELGDKIPNVTDHIKKIIDVNGFILRDFSLVDSPSTTIGRVMDGGIQKGEIGLLVIAVAIPILAGLTQFINTKLMPQNNDQQQNDNGTMAASLKTMNMVMPIMSVVFCFTFASGLGLYWVMGSVVRSIQQVLINRHFNKMDIDEVVKKNIEKINAKREKMGLPPQKISSAARINTKNIDRSNIEEKKKSNLEQSKKSTDYYESTSSSKPGSLKSKANMVKQYNEKNQK